MPRSIKTAVGRNLSNTSMDDVATVQYLLNCVPKHRGGPSRELRVNGLISEEVIQAIAGFQKASMLPVDGRVEPSSPTLKRLQPFDPFADTLSPPVLVDQFNPKELQVDK